MVGSSGVLTVVVVTRADIAQHHAPDWVRQRADQVRARVGEQVDVLALDARCAQAASALAPYLSLGQTLVLLGSSGAGKSTLTNSLLGGAIQDEPGCAVRAQVSPQRLKSYQKLLRESRRDNMGALERQSQQAQWKSMTKAGRQRRTMEQEHG